MMTACTKQTQKNIHARFSDGDKRFEKSDDLILYRYMSFDSFKALMDSEALKFGSIQEYSKEDSYEGVTPPLVQQSARRSLPPSLQPDDSMLDYLRKGSEKMKQRVFASCWYCGEEESQRMWEKRGDKGKGVLLKTNFQKLRESFFKPIDFDTNRKVLNWEAYEELSKYAISIAGKIRYINHQQESDHTRFTDIFSKDMHKDKHDWGFEKEFRLLIADFSKNGDAFGTAVLVKIKLDVLIDEIILTPFSDMNAVKRLLTDKHLSPKLSMSKLIVSDRESMAGQANAK